MMGNSDNEINFLLKLLLTDRKVTRFQKVFVNNLAINEVIKNTIF